MWVVKDVPEPIYGLAVSPRLIGNQLCDRSQRKRENCIAAALQCQSYRLRTDEFAKSHHCRGVSKVTRWEERLAALLKELPFDRRILSQVALAPCIIDGEAVACDNNGMPSFDPTSRKIPRLPTTTHPRFQPGIIILSPGSGGLGLRHVDGAELSSHPVRAVRGRRNLSLHRRDCCASDRHDANSEERYLTTRTCSLTTQGSGCNPEGRLSTVIEGNAQCHSIWPRRRNSPKRR